MSLLSCASSQSAWRGYHYFLDRKVQSVKRISSTQFQGTVSGSNGEKYDVFIDVEHPRKSCCTCPHAAGKRIVCKHQVALLFSTFPLEAEKYYEEVVEYEQEQERLQEEEENKVIDCVEKMSQNQLQQALLQVLFDGPEWQYNKFIREYVDSEPYEEDTEEWNEWPVDDEEDREPFMP